MISFTVVGLYFGFLYSLEKRTLGGCALESEEFCFSFEEILSSFLVFSLSKSPTATLLGIGSLSLSEVLFEPLLATSFTSSESLSSKNCVNFWRFREILFLKQRIGSSSSVTSSSSSFITDCSVRFSPCKTFLSTSKFSF